MTEQNVNDLASQYLDEAMRQFRGHKRLTEGALSQLKDEEIFMTLDAEANSVAIIVKHLAGNMRSRFVDFLSSDGEKPDRNRDMEFEAPPTTRTEVMQLWETGWEYVFSALMPLSDADLIRTVLIRTEPHSVMQAISRQIAHYCSHIGQIIFLAKHFAGDQWKAVTISRGKSAEFTGKVAKGQLSQR